MFNSKGKDQKQTTCKGDRVLLVFQSQLCHGEGTSFDEYEYCWGNCRTCWESYYVSYVIKSYLPPSYSPTGMAWVSPGDLPSNVPLPTTSTQFRPAPNHNIGTGCASLPDVYIGTNLQVDGGITGWGRIMDRLIIITPLTLLLHFNFTGAA